MDLNGKRVLITGGSSGIGLATAERLGQRGARVVITGRRKEALAKALSHLQASGGEFHSVQADVAETSGREATLAQALAHLGGLDVLINNAGGVRAGRLETMSESDIRAMIDTDLTAPILLTRAALPALRQSGDGLIVNRVRDRAARRSVLRRLCRLESGPRPVR